MFVTANKGNQVRNTILNNTVSLSDFIMLAVVHNSVVPSSNVPAGSDANELTVYADISEVAINDVSVLCVLWF